MASDGFYDRDELFGLGFREVGSDVLVSRKACFYALDATIGSHSRIDDFSILKGRIDIGRYVHISAFCLIGATRGKVVFEDCTALACRVSVYTASDDYRAPTLSNPTVPPQFSTTVSGNVSFGVGSIIGAHSVVLPDSVVGAGASVGAFGLVRGRIAPGSILVSAGALQMRRMGSRDAAKILALRDELIGGSAPKDKQE